MSNATKNPSSNAPNGWAPVTYYPVAMQRQWLAARAAVADSPYERHFARDLTVPVHVARQIQQGPMAPDPAFAPTLENINGLLAEGGATAECGYTVLEGPTLYVQSKIAFPGSTSDMFRWWFWWHALDSRRYMLWFPYSHMSAKSHDPQRLADNSLTFEQRFYNNRQHVVELMGPDHFESIIKFTDPAELGFDRSRYQAAGFEASASGLLEMPGLPDVTVGMMVHIVRPVPGGLELISRYWLGSHPALARFPGANRASEIFASVGMTAAKMESVAYELAVHDMTEWNHLARILPPLYAEFGP